MEARLWIEAEHLAEEINDFCNIVVTFSSGQRFAMNVWTFSFFDTAINDGEMHASPEKKHLYIHPPDLFVKDLTRPTLEAVVVDLIERGRLPADCLVAEEAE